MIKSLNLKVDPQVGFDEDKIKSLVGKQLGISEEDLTFKLKNRSIDARSKKVWVHLSVDVYIGQKLETPAQPWIPQNVESKDEVIIVGAGPAGLFAALELIQLGLKPIILERGKDVQARRRDIAAINKEHIVNPDSNYCYGEGGAGTYSDGKLYTRSKKRGDVTQILETLVQFGARKEILIDAHPHIGTNKLPQIIEAMREAIVNHGGELRFNTKVTDLIVKSGTITGVINQHGESILGSAVILATGHSARDIYQLLDSKKILIEAKPFALGVRVEHPQALIDQIQYHCDDRGPYLPASSYSLVQQAPINNINRGVFSFCMCPGGFIVPAATSPGEVVVNGMSPSRRDSKFANSGIVVSVELEDLKDYSKFGALAALKFQGDVEQKAWKLGGETQAAPAQRLSDFVRRKTSNTLPETSYQPGLASQSMDDVLPDSIAARLRYAFKGFDRKMKGYLTNEAQIVGVESRTSSPVKIPRDSTTLQHVEVSRLYPCGEGAGYAGGIVSAALDGVRVAKSIHQLIAH